MSNLLKLRNKDVNGQDIRKKVWVNLAMPSGMRERLKAAASINEMTMKNFILATLFEGLKEQEEKAGEIIRKRIEENDWKDGSESEGNPFNVKKKMYRGLSPHREERERLAKKYGKMARAAREMEQRTLAVSTHQNPDEWMPEPAGTHQFEAETHNLTDETHQLEEDEEQPKDDINDGDWDEKWDDCDFS